MCLKGSNCACFFTHFRHKGTKDSNKVIFLYLRFYWGIWNKRTDCRSGETGRRTGLKIPRGQLHVGSIPTSGTITIERDSARLVGSPFVFFWVQNNICPTIAPPFQYFREVRFVKNTNVGVTADGYYYADCTPSSAFWGIWFRFIILPYPYEKTKRPYRVGCFRPPYPDFRMGVELYMALRSIIQNKKDFWNIF